MIVKLPGMEYTPSPGDMAHEFWESDAERQSEMLYYLADVYENDLFAWCRQMAYVGKELSTDQRKKVVNMLKEMVNQIEGKDMCGTKDKPCCTCFCGDGGCLASMREDFYMPATEEQVRKRLENGSYPEYQDVMKTYLKALEIVAEQTIPSLKDMSRMNQILRERLYCCEDN